MEVGEDYAHFRIEEGILYVVYKPNTIIDLKAAKAVVKARLRFQKGKPYPILCDIRLLKTVIKGAREYLAERGCDNSFAIGLVIDQAYAGTLTSAFLNISNPPVPTRAFTTIEEALHFLEDYK